MSFFLSKNAFQDAHRVSVLNKSEDIYFLAPIWRLEKTHTNSSLEAYQKGWCICIKEMVN